jgi:deazaflavin-dependent oxidoreductase (nitroreductase family)
VVRIVEAERYVAVASAGGARRNPSRYANLVAHPAVRLQDGAAIRLLRAREVFGDEEAHYWTVAESFWPHSPEYRQRAGRAERWARTVFQTGRSDNIRRMAKKPAPPKPPPARERLLAASDELFYRDGVHSTGIDAVIEKAGVAKGSLYDIFGGKDELIPAYLRGRHESWRKQGEELESTVDEATRMMDDTSTGTAKTARRIAQLTLAAAKASSSV